MTTGPEQPGQHPNQPPPGPPPGPPYGMSPQHYGPPPPGRYPQPPLRPDEEKTWAIAAHLGPLLLGFIAPLVVWLVYRERSMFLDRTAKEALNFQLTLLIGYLVGFVTACFLVGFVLIFVVWVAAVVFEILAAVAVGRFEDYRYPVNIRFIS